MWWIREEKEVSLSIIGVDVGYLVCECTLGAFVELDHPSIV